MIYKYYTESDSPSGRVIVTIEITSSKRKQIVDIPEYINGVKVFETNTGNRRLSNKDIKILNELIAKNTGYNEINPQKIRKLRKEFELRINKLYKNNSFDSKACIITVCKELKINNKLLKLMYPERNTYNEIVKAIIGEHNK